MDAQLYINLLKEKDPNIVKARRDEILNNYKKCSEAIHSEIETLKKNYPKAKRMRYLSTGCVIMAILSAISLLILAILNIGRPNVPSLIGVIVFTIGFTVFDILSTRYGSSNVVDLMNANKENFNNFTLIAALYEAKDKEYKLSKVINYYEKLYGAFEKIAKEQNLTVEELYRKETEEEIEKPSKRSNN